MMRKAPEWLNPNRLNKEISASAPLGCRKSVKIHLLKTPFHSLGGNYRFSHSISDQQLLRVINFSRMFYAGFLCMNSTKLLQI